MPGRCEASAHGTQMARNLLSKSRSGFGCASATRLHSPGHPLADENGDVWVSPVNETAEMVEIMESARHYQNLVEAMQTAKQLMLETLRSN